ncbi:MAG: hypothetical protein ACK55N_06050, partial [Planctomycetota bacterium]
VPPYDLFCPILLLRLFIYLSLPGYLIVGWDKVAGRLNQSIFQSKTLEQQQTPATAGPPAVPG